MHQNRADRILIAAALAILMLAGGLFYFDDWMWGARRKRGDRIGVLSNKTGDVRMKFDGDLKWEKASYGEDLLYNDSVYAGAGSHAQLQLGESEMTVTENTLVVLRRDDKVNFMNLAYGSLFGKVAKNEKVVIDTGEGNKPIELLTSSAARITVRKQGKRTELEVTSGEADVTINGKKSRLNKDSKIVVAEAHPPKVEPITLELVKPLRDQVYYSENVGQLGFEWKWSSSRKPAASDIFNVEFSSGPSFSKLHLKRTVHGKMTTSLNASESLNLYYRVRGPHGIVSNIEKVNFVRMHTPIIIKPIAESKFVVPAQTNALVGIEFRLPKNSTAWYQVADDPEFKNILANENTKELQAVRELPVGSYFLRARADFGNNHISRWTSTVPFTIEKKVEVLRLSQSPSNGKVLIPNRNYEKRLYSANANQVKRSLAEQGLLQNFFPFSKDEFNQLQLQFESSSGKPSQLISQTNSAWPQDKLRPGAYNYKYQAIKEGFLPSGWSTTQNLEIAMEPPHSLGDVRFKPIPNDKAGASEAQWGFTPLLFARKYDVEISKDPNMTNPRQLQVSKAAVRTKLVGENYWRVRARDGQNQIISDFSSIEQITAPVPPKPVPVPIVQAKQEPPKPPPPKPEPPAERKPAQTATNTSTTRIRRHREEVFEKNGWWAWLGVGQNFVDYNQSSKDVGTASNQRVMGPSKFVEGGFVSKGDWGGVVSYKTTPGEINPAPETNPVDSPSYTWTTVSLEGVRRKQSKYTMLGSPIVYGMRLGVQEHSMPFLFVKDSFSGLQLKKQSTTAGSAGILAEWLRRRWTYYWLMRYQYPLTSKAEGSAQWEMNPVFAFDGSIGTAYHVTRRLKAGLFWYGQWHQFNFVYSDGTDANNGFQSLFYSNLDFRLGYDF